MAVINTNITALIGQQNLTRSQGALQTAMERLSSGLRINSAADDAAGQAIANRMGSQITGLSQAQRNANDGISISQTAESALGQVNDNLQRIRQLTVQAANGTNTSTDLASIQKEITQRLAEINRVGSQTSFNGIKVLDGSSSTTTIKIQVGANDGETISLSLSKVSTTTLGVSTFTVSTGVASTALATLDSAIAKVDDTFSQLVRYEIEGALSPLIKKRFVRVDRIVSSADGDAGNTYVEYTNLYTGQSQRVPL